MNDALSREISNYLVKMRTNRGLTQQELSDRLSVTRACYAHYEQGARDIPMETLMKVCDICGFEIEEVVSHLKKFAFK